MNKYNEWMVTHSVPERRCWQAWHFVARRINPPTPLSILFVLETPENFSEDSLARVLYDCLWIHGMQRFERI